MDIRQLKHLVALVEHSTVHAAAKAQFISQPGLSGSIKRLEKYLGTELFLRDGRGMKPNKKGREFYQHAKHILEQVRLAEADLERVPKNLYVGLGEIRPSDFAAFLYDSLLQTYPNLLITFYEGHFNTLYTQVEQGDIDVAFVASPPDRVSAALLGYPLVKTEFGVFCSPDHPLASYSGRVPLVELMKYDWVRNAMAPSEAPYIPRFTGRKKNPLETARYVLAGSQQMAKDLLLNSNLLGYGPRVAFDVELAAGSVTKLNLPITKLSTSIFEIRRRDAHSAVLDRAFAIAEDYYRNRPYV